MMQVMVASVLQARGLVDGARRRVQTAWRILHLGAVVLALGLSPSTFRPPWRHRLAAQVVRAALPLLSWFTLLAAIVSVVIIRIVLVTAQSYGLSQVALDVVVRVLVLELIPLSAAFAVALRVSVPLAGELAHLRQQGLLDRAADPLRSEIAPRALASVLGVLEEPGQTVTDSLLAYVRDKQLLVILDNCEHVRHAAAELAKQLLQAGAGVKVLASSRDVLQVAGETVYPVPTLGVPGPGVPVDLPALARHEAVRLFVDRASAAQAAFVLDSANADAVAQICQRLDGIPLALALAAARTRALSVQAIAARLHDRFRLLVSGDQTVLPRQRTLRALIDWSFDLLSDAERVLFRRLAVFAGGWTLDAAEAVGAGEGELAGHVGGPEAAQEAAQAAELTGVDEVLEAADEAEGDAVGDGVALALWRGLVGERAPLAQQAVDEAREVVAVGGPAGEQAQGQLVDVGLGL